MDTTNQNARTLDPADRTEHLRWTVEQVAALFGLPFSDLIHRAHTVHRAHFDPNAVQLSTLLSIKTGGCSEDCGYCPQSARYRTEVENQDLLAIDDVVAAARAAKEKGATRFCMGAAWRGLSSTTSSACSKW